MTKQELATWAGALEERPPQEILARAAERFAPRIGFATGFGAEGCALIDMAARQGLAIDYFTLDTGFLFPETYALWRKLEERYGIAIRGVRPWRDGPAAARPGHGGPTSPEREPPARGGPPPWEVDPDACCAARKVKPLRAELARFDAWITAIRRDQTPDRAGARAVEWDDRFGLVKVNPLARWSAADVASYVEAHRVPVNPLHARGYPSIGCVPCTSPVRPGEDPRAGRWRGSAKKECGLHARYAWASAPAPSDPETEKTR
jgi:phosphoadenylyl-sulfate reductase (thioredoxin)